MVRLLQVNPLRSFLRQPTCAVDHFLFFCCGDILWVSLGRCTQYLQAAFHPDLFVIKKDDLPPFKMVAVSLDILLSFIVSVPRPEFVNELID
jgi:hypothetical protein